MNRRASGQPIEQDGNVVLASRSGWTICACSAFPYDGLRGIKGLAGQNIRGLKGAALSWTPLLSPVIGTKSGTASPPPRPSWARSPNLQIRNTSPHLG